jgi:tetratricopeptide (TPR) repeat protein
VIRKEASEFDEAIAHFTRAESLRPGDFGVRYQIASLMVARGDTEAALPKLEALVKEAPTFVEAHVSLATVYYRLKRKADGDREKAMVAELQAQGAGVQGAGVQGAGCRVPWGRASALQDAGCRVQSACSAGLEACFLDFSRA